jgi:hypothetical protein
VFRPKDVQYGEYPKDMLEDSRTEGTGKKNQSPADEVGYFKVCKEY